MNQLRVMRRKYAAHIILKKRYASSTKTICSVQLAANQHNKMSTLIIFLYAAKNYKLMQ